MEKIELEEKMMDIGIPTGLKGFDYTVEYILLSESGRFGDHPKVTALYAVVGKKFGVSYLTVERDIRSLVNACKRELDPEKFTYYFGTSPTNGNAIDRLKRRIKIELERQGGKMMSSLRCRKCNCLCDPSDLQNGICDDCRKEMEQKEKQSSIIARMMNMDFEQLKLEDILK